MLGRYQLLFLLGQGGMGEVHLAKLTGAAGFEKLCIVKTILPQMQADPQFVERFHHEARVLVQLNHSNIAQVHDMGEVEGTLYMAIEYVAGVDLSRVESRVRQQRAVVPIPIALYVGQQVAEALGYAHRKAGPDGTPLGIVHRDVSPQNVMVSYEGEVKVIDFGLAKSAVRSQHTLPQTVMGKLGYMSPEQAMAKQVDHRSDIFSAGIIAWEMLTGRAMYEGGTMGEMVAKMAHPNIESPRAIRPEISPALEQIVMRALQVDPVARYSRADEFARALNELAVREGLTVGAEEVGNYVRAMCPDEFAAERQLQSKLSMMRRKDPEVSEPDWEEQQELGGTLVRPSRPQLEDVEMMTPAQRAVSVVSSPAPGPNPGRGRTVVRPQGVQASPPPSRKGKGGTVMRPATPASFSPVQPDIGSGPILVPRSKAPLYSVLGALAIGVLAIGGYYLSGKSDQRTTAPVVATAEEKEPALKNPRSEGKPPEQESHTEPAREDADSGGPAQGDPSKVPEREEPPSRGTVEVAGTPVPVRLDGDVAVVLVARGARAPFEEGDAVLLIGEATGKRAPLYAHGTVVDVKPTMAKIMTTDLRPGVATDVFAIKDPKVKPAAVARKRATSSSSSPSSPSSSSEWRTIEPSSGGESGRGEPSKAENPKSPKEGAAEAPAKVGIRGVISVSSADAPGGQIVRIINQNRVPLTGCTVRLTSNRSAPVQLIGPNTEVRLRYSVFRPDAKPPDANFQQGWSAVYCREGTGYFYTTWASR